VGVDEYWGGVPFYDDKEFYAEKPMKEEISIKLKQNERDKLLIRLEERTNNIWRMVEKIERHSANQNGLILEALKIGHGNKVWIRVLYGFIISSVGVIGWLSKLQGLW